MREKILKLVQGIHPLDDIERGHIANALAWIRSGEEIFRIAKPDVPPKHLVSYFVVIDLEVKKILLLDHIKAELWLPSGGHVEKDKSPRITVEREIREELSVEANFFLEEPFFLTQTVTVGKTAGHTDVTFWYVLCADSTQPIEYDRREFYGYRWFTFEEILCEEKKHL